MKRVVLNPEEREAVKKIVRPLYDGEEEAVSSKRSFNLHNSPNEEPTDVEREMREFLY